MKNVELFGQTYKVSDYELVQFDNIKIIAIDKIEKKLIALTARDVDNIICTAIEGGIGYWARMDKSVMEWDLKPKYMAASEYISIRLLSGKSAYFFDNELWDDEENRVLWELTLDKLVKGYVQNYKERPHDNDLEQGDATTCDCIVQYALFGEVVYG